MGRVWAGKRKKKQQVGNKRKRGSTPSVLNESRDVAPVAVLLRNEEKNEFSFVFYTCQILIGVDRSNMIYLVTPSSGPCEADDIHRI